MTSGITLHQNQVKNGQTIEASFIDDDGVTVDPALAVELGFEVPGGTDLAHTIGTCIKVYTATAHEIQKGRG